VRLPRDDVLAFRYDRAAAKIGGQSCTSGFRSVDRDASKKSLTS